MRDTNSRGLHHPVRFPYTRDAEACALSAAVALDHAVAGITERLRFGDAVERALDSTLGP
jgi:hypothetical protein